MAKSSFKPNITTPKTTNYREFFHDMRLNSGFINVLNKDAILSAPNSTENQQVTWYFHEYKTPKGTANLAKAPDKARLKQVQGWLCATPEGEGKRYIKDNFAFGTSSALQQKCAGLTKDRVMLRNTYSYFKQLLEYVGSDEALEFYEDLKNID
ncbi:hypothetical protein [Colwellia sp. RSH04]|uniref:hypothetical protein n=1 Tax=Colwellia sp. RSH04 TaxID=2305464 RepID=UPI0011C23EEE|nr:hypothetical protein [Colwellia sp. RSH04]